MNLHCHCLEGLDLSRSALNCCRRREDDEDADDNTSSTGTIDTANPPATNGRKTTPSRLRATSAPPPHLTLIQASDVDICVLSAPAHQLVTLGRDEEARDDRWDFMMVDRECRIVMMAGPRFRTFCLIEEFKSEDAPPDLLHSRRLDEVFPTSVVNILMPLFERGLKNQSAQLHTYYQGQRHMTFFVFGLCNEHNQVVSAILIYRPTRYNQGDVSRFIITQDAAITSSVPANNAN
jgi:hypothetical protein